MSRLLLLLLSGFLFFGMSACGSVSGTNGSLSMSELAVKTVSSKTSVTGTATFSPPAGKVANGTQVDVTIYVPNGNPTSITTPFTLGPDGNANFSFDVDHQAAAVNVTVTATTGGLSVTKTATIPANP